MRNVYILSAALEIVEERLKEPLQPEMLARAVYCSVSGLNKLFRYAFNYPVGQYIAKRRLSCASRELLAGSRSVTDIALDYQYSSPEVFTRAFRRFWGITPSEFRKIHRFHELFPKFETRIDTGGVAMSGRRPVDISELYDELRKLSGTYILSVDIRQFMQINKTYGHAVGDLVLAGVFRRLEELLPDGMMLFRVGGDEFAVVTGYTDLRDAEALARSITARNGEAVTAGDREIPLSLWVGVSRIPEGALSYHKALDMMMNSIYKARNEEDGVSVYCE